MLTLGQRVLAAEETFTVDKDFPRRKIYLLGPERRERGEREIGERGSERREREEEVLLRHSNLIDLYRCSSPLLFLLDPF